MFDFSLCLFFWLDAQWLRALHPRRLAVKPKRSEGGGEGLYLRVPERRCLLEIIIAPVLEAVGWRGNALHVFMVDQVSVFHYWRGDNSPSCSSNLQPPEVSEQLTSTSLMFGLLAALSTVLQWGWVSAHLFISAPAPVLWSSGALSHITRSSHQSKQANKWISVIPFFSSYWTFYNIWLLMSQCMCLKCVNTLTRVYKHSRGEREPVTLMSRWQIEVREEEDMNKIIDNVFYNLHLTNKHLVSWLSS